MKAKIEARKDIGYGIYNNLIKFLKAINQHALNDQESRYKMLVILDVFTTFFGARQKYQ